MRILLLGDSIRLSYRTRVQELLDGRATIIGPDENCSFSANTLCRCSAWANEETYDAIQWNNGQWDTAHLADGRKQTPMTQYLEIQQRIASILHQFTDRLIFATTTPVKGDGMPSERPRHRSNADISAYNHAVSAMLSAEGVEILDLYNVVYPHRDSYIVDDLVHLSPEGVEACAKHVANNFVRA